MGLLPVQVEPHAMTLQSIDHRARRREGDGKSRGARRDPGAFRRGTVLAEMVVLSSPRGLAVVLG